MPRRSAEAYDRGGKWEAYQRLASLTDYVLVAQTEGSWRYRVAESGERLTLANGAKLEVDAVYEGAFELETG